VASYCGVPAAVGDLYNYQTDYRGFPLGDFYNRDPRVPNVPTDRSYVQQDVASVDEQDASKNDINAWGIEAPESAPLGPVRAVRGVDDTLYTAYQTYNRDILGETHRIHNSLGREMLNDWNDARFNVGGTGYAYDNISATGVHWASSPGYKGDAWDPKYNPQIYMRPGVKLAAGFSSINAVPPGQMPR
jgi:hypothetical protein